MQKKGKIVDVFNRRIFNAEITVENGKIKKIEEIVEAPEQYILPGFVDSHIHIESSMLIPSRFSQLSITHGTVACVCDPHEIANVLGIEGVSFMINNSKLVPQKFFFGAPSCVPATDFETSGSRLDVEQIDKLLKNDDIYFLAEMMNYPGVIFGDKQVAQKLILAQKYAKPIDGHAPLLMGEQLKKYIEAGISTDHECTNIDEAIEKISLGMKILIRNGSAAKDFDNLFELIDKFPDKVMFCTDDCHPDDLLDHHINELVKKSIAKGANLFNVLQAACINPVIHYKLPVGLLRIGDRADFIVVDNIQDFNLKEMFIDGKCVFENCKISFDTSDYTSFPNKFVAEVISELELRLKAITNKARVIVAQDHSLLTKVEISDVKAQNDIVQIDTENDILKIVVLNRYKKTNPQVALIKGFGFKNGAIATSVAHDSHNIIAVGASDKEIVNAINALIKHKGGMCVVTDSEISILPLPVAGLMSTDEPQKVAKNYEILNQKAKNLGCRLTAPFMTLSFMALLVIPSIKLSDKGLFDGDKFQFTELFI